MLEKFDRLTHKTVAKKYIFLGMPDSGKTTYFSLMANLLQQRANDSGSFKFKSLSDELPDSQEEKGRLTFGEEATAGFIKDCIRQVEKRKWPLKTQTNDRVEYSFELTRQRLIGTESTVIRYFDFAGELFKNVFNGDWNDGQKTEKMTQLVGELDEADGLFLIIDAEEMFNDCRSDEMDCILKRIFEKFKSKRIAVIFSKIDLFFGLEQLESTDELRAIFRETYVSAYGYLDVERGRCAFFPVKAFSRLEIPDDGNHPMPPADLVYDVSLLKPIQWMTGIDLNI